jgi:23S rRNA pseudouridine1911/1915/1917 synthase
MDRWNETEKVYLAIVDGKLTQKEGTSTAPLRLDKDEYRMRVGEHPDAKAATTHYKLRQSAEGRSLLEVRIETGRQHQIRAHMAWMGNPIVGDERYGKKGIRMGLHAMRLVFHHPGTDEMVHLEVDAPRDFYELLV